MKKISENIGFDGNDFFCLRCYKAGYSSVNAVRGHLAMCEGTKIRKQGERNRQLVTSMPGIGLGGVLSNQLQLVASVPRVGLSNSNQSTSQLQIEPQLLNNLTSRVTYLENELNHAVLAANSPQGILGSDKVVWIALGITVFVFLFWSEQRSNRCECLGGTNRSSSLAGRVGSRFLDKTLDKIFK